MLGPDRLTVVELDPWTAYTVNVTKWAVTIKSSPSTNPGYEEVVEPWPENICFLEKGTGEPEKLPWGNTTFRTDATGTVVPGSER